MAKPTIAAGFAAALLDYACGRGVGRAALLSASGLDESDLAAQDARVPLAAYHALIATAIAEMSENRIGSLIAFARSTGLRNYIESGTRIQADVERDLLTSIFFPNSPLHDGGVIIQGQKIEAARCIFPVSEARKLDPHLGLRHRAAIGLSERTDAFVIVTSEETGAISIAENGQLDYNLSIGEVEARLNAAFAPDRPAASEIAPPTPAASAS